MMLFLALVLLLCHSYAVEFGIAEGGFQFGNTLLADSVQAVSLSVHHSSDSIFLLQQDGELRLLPELLTVSAPRGTLIGIADGPTYLHLDAGEFLVTWPGGTEQRLDGVQNLRAGAFACTVCAMLLTPSGCVLHTCCQ
jgi:hypothetical protein